MNFPDYLLLITGMGVVTYLPRLLPLFFLSQRQLPQWLIDWLDMIPVAILAALLVPSLVVGPDNAVDLQRPELWVAIPTFLFAIWTRSLGGTVVVGMALYWMTGLL